MTGNGNQAWIELLEAAKFTLTMLEQMTSDKFEIGEDKPARDALRSAIAAVERQEHSTEYQDYRAYSVGPQLLGQLKLALTWLDNLEMVIGKVSLEDSMPNNWGGRVAIRALIAKVEDTEYIEPVHPMSRERFAELYDAWESVKGTGLLYSRVVWNEIFSYLNLMAGTIWRAETGKRDDPPLWEACLPESHPRYREP